MPGRKPRRGRPPRAGTTATAQVRVVLTDEERARWDRAAEVAEESLSEYVRVAVESRIRG